MRVPQRSKTEKRHFHHHAGPRKDEEVFSADGVGERAGRDFQEDAGHGPHHIEQGKLLQRQPEVQKEDGEDWIVKAEIEKNPKGNEEPDIPYFKG